MEVPEPVRWTKRGTPPLFMLSAKRDIAAVKRFFQKMIRADHRRLPFSISVDKHASYPEAFTTSQKEKVLPKDCKRSEHRRNDDRAGSTERRHRNCYAHTPQTCAEQIESVKPINVSNGACKNSAKAKPEQKNGAAIAK